MNKKEKHDHLNHFNNPERQITWGKEFITQTCNLNWQRKTEQEKVNTLRGVLILIFLITAGCFLSPAAGAGGGGRGAGGGSDSGYLQHLQAWLLHPGHCHT